MTQELFRTFDDMDPSAASAMGPEVLFFSIIRSSHEIDVDYHSARPNSAPLCFLSLDNLFPPRGSLSFLQVGDFLKSLRKVLKD